MTTGSAWVHFALCALLFTMGCGDTETTGTGEDGGRGGGRDAAQGDQGRHDSGPDGDGDAALPQDASASDAAMASDDAAMFDATQADLDAASDADSGDSGGSQDAALGDASDDAGLGTPDFTASVPEVVGSRQSAIARVDVSIVRGSGFTGPVEVSVTGLPGSISVSPITIEAGETEGQLEFDIDLSTAVQQYDVDVHFVAGDLDIVKDLNIAVAAAVTVTVTPPDSPVIVPKGSSRVIAIGIDGSESSSWHVTLSGLPSGITSEPASRSVSLLASAMVDFTLTAESTAVVDTSSTVTITAVPAVANLGTLGNEATFTAKVGPAPEFTASVTSTDVELVRGQATEVTVEVERETGFTAALTIGGSSGPTTIDVDSDGIAMDGTSGTVTLTPSVDDRLDLVRDLVIDITDGTVTRQITLKVRTRSSDAHLDQDFGYYGVDLTDSPWVSAAKVLCSGADTCYRITSSNTLVRKIDEVGNYDATYAGNTGYVSVGGAYRFATLAPNGDLFVGSYSGTDGGMLVQRIAPNGTLVSGWGTDGEVILSTTSIPNGTVTPLNADGGARVAALADANGLYLAGKGSSYPEMVVVRLTSTGAVDTAFDGDGWFTSTVMYAGEPTAMAMFEGRLVIARKVIGSAHITVLSTAGVPDTTFDGDGVLVVDSSGCNGAVSALRATTGRLVIVRVASSTCTYAALAVDSTGAIDTTYGTDGYAPFSDTRQYDYATFDADGRLVMVGKPDDASSLALRRYLASGALDTSYGTSGVVAFDLEPAGLEEAPTHVCALPGGAYLVSGELSSAWAFELALLP
jgi:uncharacterized delta-60 repeat protein